MSLSPDRRRILDRWDRSGLSAAEFAAVAGVGRATLYAWRRRGRDPSGRTPRRTAAAPAFLELAVGDDAARSPSPPPIEVALPRGLAVRVPPGFDPDTLRRVVDALLA